MDESALPPEVGWHSSVDTTCCFRDNFRIRCELLPSDFVVMYPLTLVEKILFKWRQNTVMEVANTECHLFWIDPFLIFLPIEAFMCSLEWIHMCYLLLFAWEQIQPSNITLEIEVILLVASDLRNNFIIDRPFPWCRLHPKNFCSCGNSVESCAI